MKVGRPVKEKSIRQLVQENYQREQASTMTVWRHIDMSRELRLYNETLELRNRAKYEYETLPTAERKETYLQAEAVFLRAELTYFKMTGKDTTRTLGGIADVMARLNGRSGSVERKPRSKGKSCIAQ